MAAVRMEDKVLKDWRTKALAKAMGREFPWALGALNLVFSYCTDEYTYTVDPKTLDGLVEANGFARALVEVGLGEDQDDGTVRIRGTEGRIEWLRERREAGRRGGRARAAQANGKQTQANGKQTQPSDSGSGSDYLKKERESADTGAALPRGTLSLDEIGPGPDPDQSPDVTTPKTRPSRASVVDDGLARREAVVFLEWFNRRVRRGFNLNGRNIDDVHRLLTRGYTQGDLRLVARHLRALWADDERMNQHLVPSAMLNAKKFAERLDAGRSTHPDWAEAHGRDDAEAKAAGGIEAWERWADEAQLRSVP